jgi:pyruvate formate lyase activating enzyme
LIALNYGLTIAAAVDPIEKKPLLHFLPGSKIYSFATVGCNLRCSWCQNWDISQNPKPQKPIQGIPVTPEQHVARALSARCPSIAYTYSEPTIFLEYALDTMISARKQNLKNVWVTNGFMTPETLELILPWLDEANVDFNGPDDEVYGMFCGATAAPVTDVIARMKDAGVHVEVTTLVIPGINDRPDQLQKIAESLILRLGPDVPWHLTRFFPAWKLFDVPPTPLRTLELAREIGRKAGLIHIHLGNV